MQHRHFCYFCKQKSENQMIQTAYYWWKFPTTFQLSEIKIWNMASRTNIFLKCHKWIFCSNIIHRHSITFKLKFQFQYMMSGSRIFNLNVRKQRKYIKAKPYCHAKIIVANFSLVYLIHESQANCYTYYNLNNA